MSKKYQSQRSHRVIKNHFDQLQIEYYETIGDSNRWKFYDAQKREFKSRKVLRLFLTLNNALDDLLDYINKKDIEEAEKMIFDFKDYEELHSILKPLSNSNDKDEETQDPNEEEQEINSQEI